MKWLRTFVLFDQGNVISSPDWTAVHTSYVRSINSIEHPRGSGALQLRRRIKLPNGQWTRNGVGYLRSNFLDHMQNKEGWQPFETNEFARTDELAHQRAQRRRV